MTKTFTPDLKHRSCPFDIYKSEGNILFLKRHYEKAIISYSQAIYIRPNSLHCYIRRSKCHLKLANTKESMDDIEFALKINSESHEAIYQKAEIYYYLTDFEDALIWYHRGKKIRPQCQLFDSGISKAEIAIRNVIGDVANIKLKVSENDDLIGTASSMIGANSHMMNIEIKRLSLYSRLHLRQLIGEFYNDINFMEKVKNSEGHRIKHFQLHMKSIKLILKNLQAQTRNDCSLNRATSNSQCILKRTEDTLLYLNRRSEFWKQQEPMYLRMQRSVNRNTENVLHDSERRGMITVQQVILTLEDIAAIQKNGDHVKVIKLCRNLRKDLKSRKDIHISELDEAHADIWAFQGVSYFQQEKWVEARDCFLHQWKLCESANLDNHKPRCLENLGRAYAKLDDFTNALEVFQNRLNFDISGLDLAWVHHEIGRCYLEQKQYDKAIEHANACQAAASKASNAEWDLNANVLIAQANYLANYLDEAKTYFELSQDIAYELDNFKALVALNDAITEVDARLEKENHRLQNEAMDPIYVRKLSQAFDPSSVITGSSEGSEMESDASANDEKKDSKIESQTSLVSITTNESTAVLKRGHLYQELSSEEEEIEDEYDKWSSNSFTNNAQPNEKKKKNKIGGKQIKKKTSKNQPEKIRRKSMDERSNIKTLTSSDDLNKHVTEEETEEVVHTESAVASKVETKEIVRKASVSEISMDDLNKHVAEEETEEVVHTESAVADKVETKEIVAKASVSDISPVSSNKKGPVMELPKETVKKVSVNEMSMVAGNDETKETVTKASVDEIATADEVTTLLTKDD